MMKNVLLSSILVGACASSAAAPVKESAARLRSGYADVNGLHYYYEIEGTGEPVLLLHGGLGNASTFAPARAALVKQHQVIAVDLQGHGRTPLGTRKIRLPDIGDDMAALLDTLGYQKVDVVGYSFGGGIAFRLAVQHPEHVRRLVVVSAPLSQDGFYPEMLPQQAQVGAAMAPAMKDTPMYKAYAAVAPDPTEFPKLLDAMGEVMRTPYDWRDDAKSLHMPVLLVYGDSDMIRLDHAVEVYKLLGGGLRDAGWQREHMSQNRLAILPGVTHYDMAEAPALATTVLGFLDAR
ncbi:MAG TPA: alpha/beta hydrolase [Kofleriaceae bacterium]|nr:alpha/beta hydrolase [Kofleriaceae bacterium]